MSWGEFFRVVPVYDWIKMGIGLITLVAVLVLSVIVVSGVATVSDVRGQFTGQLDSMEKRIIAKVTSAREARVAPLDQKVETIETTAKRADMRADRAEKKQKRLEKVVKPLERALAKDPQIVEKLVPILVPTPVVMTPVEPEDGHGGLLDFLFRKSQ